MFRLSRKMQIIRASLIGAAIIAVLSAVGAIAINKIKDDASAASDQMGIWHEGISAMTSDYQSYIYKATTTDNVTFDAFCAQHFERGPNDDGTSPRWLSASEYSGGNRDQIRLLLALYFMRNQEVPYVNDAIEDIFPNVGSQELYAYVHGAINIFYGGHGYDVWSTDVANYMRDAVGRVNDYVNATRESRDQMYWIHLISQRYTLYIADGNSQNVQNMVWVEPFWHGDLKVKKCDSNTGKCVAPEGFSFEGTEFSIYNNSGTTIALDGKNEDGDWRTIYNHGDLIETKVVSSDSPESFSAIFYYLPAGSYLIKETKANQSYQINTTPVSVDFPDTGGSGVVKTIEFGNEEVVHNLGTTAVDKDDNDKYIEAGKAATIKDTVNFAGIPNTKYWFKGTIKEKGTSNILGTVNGEGTTGSNGKGTMNMEFALTAAQLANLAGKELIVYEYMYSDAGRSNLIVKHEDDNDIAQTLYVVSLGTTAVDKDDNDKYIEAGKAATIKDTIDYCAVAGQTYTIKGVLMDKSTGQELLINGQRVAKEVNVTVPASGCGKTTMEFEFNASDIAGKDIVVYESLYSGNDKIVSHENINDPSQTVTIVSIGTTAIDDEDGEKFVAMGEQATIKDTIKYCAKANQRYVVKGILMDKSTGEELLIDGKKVENSIEVATPASGCDTVEMIFTFNASDIAGKEVVVYETLYSGDDEVVSHEDINDESQTIVIVSLATMAVDNEDGDKVLLPNTDVEVKDTVAFCLRPGQEYTIKGALMDKSTGNAALANGEPIESEVTFTPSEACGTVDVIYKFNTTGLSGKYLVSFESLYYNDELIIEHHDLDDLAETVSVGAPAPNTGSLTKKATDESGSNPTVIVAVGIGVVIAVGGYAATRLLARRRFLKY